MGGRGPPSYRDTRGLYVPAMTLYFMGDLTSVVAQFSLADNRDIFFCVGGGGK